jgi:ethanolamine permease
LTHGSRQTPVVAMLAGSGLGVVFMLILSISLGSAEAGSLIGSVLLNMAVFAAMLSYLSRAAAFLALRRDYPQLPRPFASPLGRFGGWLTIAICVVTLVCQVQDPRFLQGSFWVVIWLLLAIAYYVTIARHRLILTPDETAARKAAQLATDQVPA